MPPYSVTVKNMENKTQLNNQEGTHCTAHTNSGRLETASSEEEMRLLCVKTMT